MIKNTFIGIDPGKTGAIAVTQNYKIKIYDFEEHEKALTVLRALPLGSSHAVLEKVGSMPKQGVTSAFNFGVNFGYWQGILKTLKIPFDLITPQKWQKEMFDFMPAKGKKSPYEWKKLRKELSRTRAKNLFPSQAKNLSRKKDHNRADALLIMGYCERKYKETNKNLSFLY